MLPILLLTSVWAAGVAADPVLSYFQSCPANTSVCYADSDKEFLAGCLKLGGQVRVVVESGVVAVLTTWHRRLPGVFARPSGTHTHDRGACRLTVACFHNLLCGRARCNAMCVVVLAN